MRQLKPWEYEIPQQQTMRRKCRASGRMRCALEESGKRDLKWNYETRKVTTKERKLREERNSRIKTVTGSVKCCRGINQISLGVKSVLSFSMRMSLMT